MENTYSRTFAWWIGNLVLAAPVLAQVAPATQPQVPRVRERSCRTDVTLIADGKAACAIICPSEAGEWKAMADRIAGAIRSLGTDPVPVVLDTEAVSDRLGPLRADLQTRTLILLGDLNTNRAFLPYYASYYTCADACYPGEGGYELRTIVRPFGRPGNCLVMGASTQQGAQAGVERLLARLKELPRGQSVSLPYLLEVKLGDELARFLAPAMRELDGVVDPASLPDGKGAQAGEPQADFVRNAHLYFYTGDERFARRARDAAAKLEFASEGESQSKGTTGVNPAAREPGFAVGDYTLENLVAAWRRVSCSPAFSPADLVKLDARMYATAEAMSKAWWRIPPEKGIGNRHQTTGGLAWWALTTRLGELIEPADEAARAQLEQWQREGAAYCDGLLRHYWDDEDDYQSADSAQNAASYALQAGRLDWFTGGLARRAAERLVMTVDNLGWYAGIQGYGDALPGWERFPLDAGMLLGACTFIYQDGGFSGILERFPALQDSWGSLQPWGLHQYAVGGRIQPRLPDWMTGLGIARFTPYKLDRINSGEFMTTSIMDNFRPVGFYARPVPEARAFDKLCYRGGTRPEDSYLLLEGSSATTLTTIDTNAIIRLSDAGKLWLVHNTGRRSLYFKNAVYVGKGTNQQPMAASSELVGSNDFGTVAMAASRAPDCRGMTWTRNLVVVRDRFCAVIDQLRAVEPGSYQLACNWRTPGWAAVRDDRWQATQDDVTFCLVPASLEGVDSQRPAQRDGATRPTTLRENRSLNAAVGDQVVFENVLYTASDAKPRAFDVRRIAPGAVLVRDAADGTLWLIAGGDRGIALSGLRSDAATVLIAASEIYLIGGKQISLGDLNWTAESGPIKLDPDAAAKVRARLAEWWSSSAAPAAAPAHPSQQPPSTSVSGPKSAWRSAGPASRGALVDGVQFIKGRNVTGLSLLATDWIMPLLAAEPRLMGRQQSELIKETRQEQAATIAEAEPALAPLKDAEFTLEMPGPTRIADIDIFGDTFGETVDQMPPGTLTLEMTLSSDGFKADRRVRRLELTRRPTFHNLYKGHTYLFECYTVAGLNEEASAARFRVLDGPGDRLTISDVQVRSAEPSRRAVPEVRAIDLDGDGRDEVLAWTDSDVGVYRSDGSKWWSRQVPEGVLAVDAWDIEADGRREIFVSRLDRQVDVHNTDGSLRWHKDYRTMKAETGNKYFGDGAAVYGMAVWEPGTSSGRELFFTSYWFTARLDASGKVKEVFRRSGHSAQIRAIPDKMPGAGGLAIRCDVPWPGSVPLQWWDVKTGQNAFENQVPNGKAVFFEVDDYNGDGKVEALVAAEQGVGLFAPREPGKIWEHMTDAPPVGVGVLNGAAGEPATICYGRQDGGVFVLGADGKLKASAILDEPLQCLTATGGPEPMVWVGTRTSLRGLRMADLSPVWQQPGSYQALTLQKLGDAHRVLAVTAEGELVAFDVAK